MATLNSGELLQSLIDSCREYTDAVLYVEGRNPYKLSLNGRGCAIFITNVTHARRADLDEYRIQCPGDLPGQFANSHSQGEIIAILGYHAESRVFSAWDPALFVNRNPNTQRFSLYTRLSELRRANQEGFARYVDAENQTVLLFRPEYLGLYIENSDFIHSATTRSLRRIVSEYGSTPIDSTPIRRITVSRRRIKITHTQYTRSPRFRAEVLSAYDNRCAMCEIQLDLIEAAHLVPHSHPDGTDLINNGVALCALHHKSFDTSLVYIDEDYTIKINDVRYKYLVKIGLNNGIRRFRRNLNRRLALPQDFSKHPLKSNIVLGNQIRGIDVG